MEARSGPLRPFNRVRVRFGSGFWVEGGEEGICQLQDRGERRDGSDFRLPWAVVRRGVEEISHVEIM